MIVSQIIKTGILSLVTYCKTHLFGGQFIIELSRLNTPKLKIKTSMNITDSKNNNLANTELKCDMGQYNVS